MSLFVYLLIWSGQLGPSNPEVSIQFCQMRSEDTKFLGTSNPEVYKFCSPRIPKFFRAQARPGSARAAAYRSHADACSQQSMSTFVDREYRVYAVSDDDHALADWAIDHGLIDSRAHLSKM